MTTRPKNLDLNQLAKRILDKSVMCSEAKRLSMLFSGVDSRAAFARQHCLNATMIQQHLKSVRPISLEYAQVYAKAFECNLSDISPRISAEIVSASAYIEHDKIEYKTNSNFAQQESNTEYAPTLGRFIKNPVVGTAQLGDNGN